MAVLAFDDDDDDPGIRLALCWYERNLRIFRRLMHLAVPGDRLVVFYGAGHGYWLQELIRTTPGYSLVAPFAFLNESREFPHDQ